MVVVMWLVGGACIGATGHVVLGGRGAKQAEEEPVAVGGGVKPSVNHLLILRPYKLTDCEWFWGLESWRSKSPSETSASGTVARPSPAAVDLGQQMSGGNTAFLGRRPNILLLIVDDLGMEGVRRSRTPHIDRLARRGVFFTEAHASLPNCAPSRVSLLTGLRPDTHRVLDLKTHFRDHVPNISTLPQRFRQAGYLSLSFGKIYHQHLDDAESWSPASELAGVHHLEHRRERGNKAWHQEWCYNQYHTSESLARRAELRRAERASGKTRSVNWGMPLFERGAGEPSLFTTSPPPLPFLMQLVSYSWPAPSCRF